MMLRKEKERINNPLINAKRITDRHYGENIGARASGQSKGPAKWNGIIPFNLVIPSPTS
jgi:hypothetical protein